MVPKPGNWFLDSNDTQGIRWDVSLGGGFFDKLIFALTDATDVGAFLRIIVNGEVEQVLNKNIYTDGTTKLVLVDFGTAVKTRPSCWELHLRCCPGLHHRAPRELCRHALPERRLQPRRHPGLGGSAAGGVLLLGTALAGFALAKRRRVA